MDKIHFLSGPLQGATAELIGDEITVGRAADNAICLDDDSVSDHHALLNHRGGDWIVKDLGSAAGTYVRGDRVLVSPIQDGDKLVFGSVEMEFQAAVGKLQLPTTASAPAQPQGATWPQYRGPAARRKPSAIKTTVVKLVQLAVLAAVAAGGYFAYQKFSRMEPAGNAPSDTTKAAPMTAAPRASQPEVLSVSYTPPVTPARTVPAAVQAPPPVAAAAPARTLSATASPAIQQARLLLAQNKYAEATSYLDKVIASATDPAVASEAQAPLKQALEAQLTALLSAKQQWEAQSKTIEERLKSAQDKLTQDNQVLEQKKTDEGRVYATSGGYWFNGRWIYNTRKGTGDSSAIQAAQIVVMTDTQEVKKQTDLLSRYQAQVTLLDQQIAPIQARVTQMNAVLSTASAK